MLQPLEQSNFPVNTDGAHSVYFRVSPTEGLKVINAGFGHTSAQGLVGSALWKEAEREAETMIHAERSGITPRFISLMPVPMYGAWYPGLRMTHFEGRSLRSMNLPAAEAEVIEQKARDLLLFHGITHKDLNGGNIIIGPNDEILVVDMDPQYVEVSRYHFGNATIRKIFNKLVRVYNELTAPF